MADERQKRVALALRDVGSVLERMQHELETNVKDTAKLGEIVQRYVMDPEQGVVVKWRRLNDEVKAIGKTVDGLALADLANRVEDLETERRDRAEARRWGVREILVPTLASVVAGALTAVLVVRLGA